MTVAVLLLGQVTGVLSGIASSSKIGVPLSLLVVRGTTSIKSPSDVCMVAPCIHDQSVVSVRVLIPEIQAAGQDRCGHKTIFRCYLSICTMF